ncbi:MAG: hypothetical protein U5K51_16460 [Flavobacteriaceae bacterium]|nr:hypothetical protein [Flavobacteriaceae bacterium]
MFLILEPITQYFFSRNIGFYAINSNALESENNIKGYHYDGLYFLRKEIIAVYLDSVFAGPNFSSAGYKKIPKIQMQPKRTLLI